MVWGFLSALMSNALAFFTEGTPAVLVSLDQEYLY